MDVTSEVRNEVEVANRESSKIAEQVYTVKIRKDEDLTAATAQVADIKKLYKNIDAQRKKLTAPLRAVIKDIDSMFADPLQRLADAEKLLKEAILKYHDSVEARAAKRADKLEAQVDSGELGMGDAMGKLSSIKQAQKNVTTENGSAGIRTVRKIRITNPGELPAKYFLRERVVEALRLEVDDDVRRKGEELPAGAEWVEERQVAVRAA